MTVSPAIGSRTMRVVDCWAADNEAVKDRATDNGHHRQWRCGLWVSPPVGPRTIGPRTMRVAVDGVADDGATNDGVRNDVICDNGVTNNRSTDDRATCNMSTKNGHHQ